MKIVYNIFTKPSAALIRAIYWRKSSNGESLSEGLMRPSMASKAGLASSFFADETCSISACIALISLSESDMIEPKKIQSKQLESAPRAKELSCVISPLPYS